MEHTNHRLESLNDQRAAIVERWKALALAVYPERTARFIVREPDRFRNPVGHSVGESLEVLFDGILGDAPAEEMHPALDGILRLRAVQDLSPSAAVGFVFLLKQAIREELSGNGADPASEADLAELFGRIDRLALQAFDLFIQCREQIYDLRLREIRGRTPRPLVAYGPCGNAPADPAENGCTESETRGGCAG